MILTKCAVCATELGLTLGKKCGRCRTRYCGPECQVQHWKEGGHDTFCKQIKRAGGAEQYYANNNYAETVAVAVEKCAEDTKGQTCYICTRALHLKTKEGLVRMCACRGTAGFAHVSCLAEQAKIVFAEAEEYNKPKNPAWERWYTCSLCEQRYHGVVVCALGWACWKTYLERPGDDSVRMQAMHILSTGLGDANRHEEALHVQGADMANRRRVTPRCIDSELQIMNASASSMHSLGRHDEALKIYRFIYNIKVKRFGDDESTFITLKCFSDSLCQCAEEGKPHLWAENLALLREKVPVAQRVLGPHHPVMLQFRSALAYAIFTDESTSRDDRRAQVADFEDIARVARQVLGPAHPLTMNFENNVDWVRGHPFYTGAPYVVGSNGRKSYIC